VAAVLDAVLADVVADVVAAARVAASVAEAGPSARSPITPVAMSATAASGVAIFLMSCLPHSTMR
jgi:hypothetical protein